MKGFCYPPILTLLLFACSETPNRNDKPNKTNIDTIASEDSVAPVVRTENTLTILIDTISGKEFLEKDSTISPGDPAITPLPFAPDKKGSYYFYDSLISNSYKHERFPIYTKTYLLPPVKKVKYISPDTLEERSMCCCNIPTDSLLRINKYKYRLPDIGKFEVYYMSNDTRIFNDFTRAFNNYCGNSVYNYGGTYGHLIVYDKKSQEAKVLIIYFNYYMDAAHYRQFSIDKNYTIELNDYMVSEGENGADEPVTDNYKIQLTKDGNFIIQSITYNTIE